MAAAPGAGAAAAAASTTAGAAAAASSSSSAPAPTAGVTSVAWTPFDVLAPFEAQCGGVVLDGGLATALEANGHVLNTKLWSAALLTTADGRAAIERVHYEALLSGADVITTATYQATCAGFRQHLGVKTDDEAVGYMRAAITCAANARTKFWSDPKNRVARAARPLIALSLGCYGASLANGAEYTGDYGHGVTVDTLQQFHTVRIRQCLALPLHDHAHDDDLPAIDAAVRRVRASEVDLLAFETIPNVMEAQAIARCCAWLQLSCPQLPVWVSFVCRPVATATTGTTHTSNTPAANNNKNNTPALITAVAAAAGAGEAKQQQTPQQPKPAPPPPPPPTTTVAPTAAVWVSSGEPLHECVSALLAPMMITTDPTTDAGDDDDTGRSSGGGSDAPVRNIAAVGVNCTPPQSVTACLQAVRDAIIDVYVALDARNAAARHTHRSQQGLPFRWSPTVGWAPRLVCYPNSGERWDGDTKTWHPPPPALPPPPPAAAAAAGAAAVTAAAPTPQAATPAAAAAKPDAAPNAGAVAPSASSSSSAVTAAAADDPALSAWCACARDWKARSGATLIGGCCRTGAPHIGFVRTQLFPLQQSPPTPVVAADLAAVHAAAAAAAR